MTGTLVTFTGAGLDPARNPDDAKTQAVVLPGGATYPAGQVLGLVPGTGTAVNEVQTVTITGTPTGGSIRLIFNGQTTAAIAYNAAAAAVQAALEALSNVGVGQVTCGGGAFPGTAVTVTFTGTLAGRAPPTLVATSSLTGGSSPAVAVAVTTAGKPAGGYWKDYNDALSDGSQVARAILKESVTTAENGSILTIAGDNSGMGQLTATAYYSGEFFTADLTGIDANGVTDLGRIVSGIPGTLTNSATILRIG